MKAWVVTTRCGDNGSDIVWADTASIAKRQAQACDCCEDEPWTEIRANRIKDLDGMEEICAKEGAWFTDEIRLILVRDHDWACIEPEYADCDRCCAKQYCHWHDE